MWRSVLREYFAFPKKERKGIFILLVIWLSVITYQLISSENISENKWTYYVLEDVKKMNADESANTSTYPKFIPKSKYVHESTFKELHALGISTKTSAIIIKFIKSGANLKKFSTLEKVYSITEEELKILGQNYLFDKYEEQNNVERVEYERKPIKRQHIDINTADTSELESLKGIGWKLSKRIFNYREKLGGFVRKEQLLEVYGIDTALYNTIEGSVVLDTNAVRKININECSVEELSKFPYVGWKLAKIIINYRSQHGDFKNLNDLLKIKVLNSEQVQKLEPYLKF